jgi:hypothetical protein
MKPHPLTIEYLRSFPLRPGMFIQDCDLRQLEHQLHGFDAGLEAAGVMGEFEQFNRAFSDFLLSVASMHCIQGWASELIEKYGPNEVCLQEFVSLVKRAVPVLGSHE